MVSSTELIPLLLGVLLGLSVAATAEAQENIEIYLGGVVGVSALSPDTTSSTTGNDGGFAFSHYAPENGPVLNLFAAPMSPSTSRFRQTTAGIGMT